MQRVIHRFPAHDDSEIQLTISLEAAGPRIEWRRCRQSGRGTLEVLERFPIRLAWIPELMEGLARAEEGLREMEAGLPPGAALAAPGGADGGTVIVLPGGRPPAAQPEPADPSLRVSGRYPRFGIRAPLIVAVQSKDLTGPRILTGDAVNISWGGLQALLPSKLPAGTVLEILVGLGGKRALKLPARVVWGQIPPGLAQHKPHGLEFLPADPRLRQMVEQYITQVARATP